MSVAKRKILIQLSGSIAAYKCCELISRLVQQGYDVKTTCTQSALQFIGPATLEGLTGHAPLTDLFTAGHRMEHITLARWADMILVCPASAHTINRLAQGLADDWIGAVFLANNFKKPHWIAPAMNTEMLRHPATQAALAKLTDWGSIILDTGDGSLACGERGEGRLAEPDELLQQISAAFTTRSVNAAGSRDQRVVPEPRP